MEGRRKDGRTEGEQKRRDKIGEPFTEVRGIEDLYGKEHNRMKKHKYKNKQKGIYGRASLQDVKELKEEGIETEMLPWIEDKEN